LAEYVVNEFNPDTSSPPARENTRFPVLEKSYCEPISLFVCTREDLQFIYVSEVATP